MEHQSSFQPDAHSNQYELIHCKLSEQQQQDQQPQQYDCNQQQQLSNHQTYQNHNLANTNYELVQFTDHQTVETNGWAMQNNPANQHQVSFENSATISSKYSYDHDDNNNNNNLCLNDQQVPMATSICCNFNTTKDLDLEYQSQVEEQSQSQSYMNQMATLSANYEIPVGRSHMIISEHVDAIQQEGPTLSSPQNFQYSSNDCHVQQLGANSYCENQQITGCSSVNSNNFQVNNNRYQDDLFVGQPISYQFQQVESQQQMQPHQPSEQNLMVPNEMPNFENYSDSPLINSLTPSSSLASPQTCASSGSSTSGSQEVSNESRKLIKRPLKASGENHKSSKINGKLWEFIRDLLMSDKTNPSFIMWERREDGVFKFVKSEKVAKMWGERKQNPKMTYEKLSRAMRYYYKNKVLLPVFGRRLVYKFGPNAKGWLLNEQQANSSD